MLNNGNHHCASLQAVFNTQGVIALSFSILEDRIPEGELRRREYCWSEERRGINAWPGEIIKEIKRQKIIEAIRAGQTYREIAAEHQVSLGTIANIKVQ